MTAGMVCAFQREAAMDSADCRRYYQTWKGEGYSSIEGLVFSAQLSNAERCYAAARALHRALIEAIESEQT